MLTIHTENPSSCIVWHPGMTRPAATPIWLDLLDPDPAERVCAESLLGASLPQRDQISAIELSSRLRGDHDILRLNVPAFARGDAGLGAMTPLGFVL
ncbi:MAG: hypothetical protein JSR65_09275, partial [Proteobacteria bacterium]|nr:hypothetical protein [Pseudomonadota bacterium]